LADLDESVFLQMKGSGIKTLPPADYALRREVLQKALVYRIMKIRLAKTYKTEYQQYLEKNLDEGTIDRFARMRLAEPDKSDAELQKELGPDILIGLIRAIQSPKWEYLKVIQEWTYEAAKGADHDIKEDEMREILRQKLISRINNVNAQATVDTLKTDGEPDWKYLGTLASWAQKAYDEWGIEPKNLELNEEEEYILADFLFSKNKKEHGNLVIEVK